MACAYCVSKTNAGNAKYLIANFLTYMGISGFLRADIILDAARTGEVGDGKIMVLPIEKIYRIRTGESDQDAVTPVVTDS